MVVKKLASKNVDRKGVNLPTLIKRWQISLVIAFEMCTAQVIKPACVAGIWASSASYAYAKRVLLLLKMSREIQTLESGHMFSQYIEMNRPQAK